MPHLMNLSSFEYLMIIDGSIGLFLLLVVAAVIYITAYYDKLHPNEKIDVATDDSIQTPEIYFVNINPFTGMSGATTPATTKDNHITKRSD